MTPEEPQVAVVILNWNGWPDTIRCLASVERERYAHARVIVVDNGSCDASPEKLAEWARARYGVAAVTLARVDGAQRGGLLRGGGVVHDPGRFTLLALRQNLGFSGGVNAAIAHVLETLPETKYVFLLNNDAALVPGCVRECVHVAEQEDAAIVGAIIEDHAGACVLFRGARFPAELFFRAPMPSQPAVRSWPVGRTNGCAMLVRTDLLKHRIREQRYFLDPALFLYGEETELCVQARQWGYKVLMAGAAAVRHEHAASAGSLLPHYYITRNRVYLARRLLTAGRRILFHLWFVPSRLGAIALRHMRSEHAEARAILRGVVDGYLGRSGPCRHALQGTAAVARTTASARSG